MQNKFTQGRGVSRDHILFIFINIHQLPIPQGWWVENTRREGKKIMFSPEAYSCIVETCRHKEMQVLVYEQK